MIPLVSLVLGMTATQAAVTSDVKLEEVRLMLETASLKDDCTLSGIVLEDGDQPKVRATLKVDNQIIGLEVFERNGDDPNATSKIDRTLNGDVPYWRFTQRPTNDDHAIRGWDWLVNDGTGDTVEFSINLPENLIDCAPQ